MIELTVFWFIMVVVASMLLGGLLIALRVNVIIKKGWFEND